MRGRILNERGEETSCSGEDCDEDILSTVNMTEPLGDVEVMVLTQSSEFLGSVDCYNGYSAAELAFDAFDCLGGCVHDGRKGARLWVVKEYV